MNVRPMDKSDSYKECCPVEVKELKGTRGKEQVMRIATDEFLDYAQDDFELVVEIVRVRHELSKYGNG